MPERDKTAKIEGFYVGSQPVMVDEAKSKEDRRRGLITFDSYFGHKHLSFYKLRYLFLGLSGLVLLTGVIFSMVFGIQLDIQFRGGSILQYSYTGDLDPDAAAELIENEIGQPVSAQITEDFATDATSLVVNLAGNKSLTTDQQTQIRELLTSSYPDNNIQVEDVQTVDAFIGKEMLIKGIVALLIASVLIVGYVWVRFISISGPSAGVFALLALLHDILIAFFVFVFMRSPIDETVLAVVLSILGWSVNDTIVIYDRIRENSRLYRGKLSLQDLTDLSIRQSLTRSLNTALCSFAAILIAYIFALAYNIESIKTFTLPMMIGILAGSYSTIFLAAPFWSQWKTRKGRSGYEQRAKHIEE